MLNADFIEAVIGLAPNLFYGTGLAASVLILRTAKPAGREGKVLFVNGERLFKRGRNQNTLEPEHATTLLSAYQAFADQPGLAHVAALNNIQANGYDLNIPLYVEPAQGDDQISLAQALSNLEVAYAAASDTKAALDTELAKWGLGA
jgi:type I restriction enzyme M protein